jgi:fucose 4-O-acetylase-like acetyltransferase
VVRASGRLDDIDRAKGLACLLVVFGHIVSRRTPPGHEWYGVLKEAIYHVHMPFFVYLSGLVFFYIAADRRLGSLYWPAARTRASGCSSRFSHSV